MKEVVAAQGWQARLDLEYALRGRRTRLMHKRQSGPLTLQRSFYPEGNTCHNYILHPPGGVVGGDTLQIDVSVDTGAHTLLTTPGATKFYRSESHKRARQSQSLTIADGAVLEWLPQQNILFNGSNACLSTHIDIAPDAKFIGWEMHCFGRPSNSEAFTNGSLHSQTRVYVAGELRLLEQFTTHGDDALLSATGLRGMAMQGCLIAAPCHETHRQVLEQILQSREVEPYPYPLGLTLVDEVLVVRALGQQTEPMLELFTRLWMALRLHWLQKEPSLPRIWAT